MNVDLKRFDNPDEVRTFEKGKFEILRIGGMANTRTRIWLSTRRAKCDQLN
jgi:hypothetical protein